MQRQFIQLCNQDINFLKFYYKSPATFSLVVLVLSQTNNQYEYQDWMKWNLTTFTDKYSGNFFRNRAKLSEIWDKPDRIYYKYVYYAYDI